MKKFLQLLVFFGVFQSVSGQDFVTTWGTVGNNNGTIFSTGIKFKATTTGIVSYT